MKISEIKHSKPLFRIEAGEKDWHAQSREDLLWMLQQMLLIRFFEEKLLVLKDCGLVNGPVHTSVGQEAVAAGAATAVSASDKFSGTHRAHHQYLAKALNFCSGKKYDPLKSGINCEMRKHIATLLKEIMGLAGGCSGGRGGSMHLFNDKIGVIGTNAIVGGGVPVATGVAWADRFRNNNSITLCFFGDGALYQGTVHEACNLASIWKAKIVYVIENNQYAVGTKRLNACSSPNLSQIALAYDMPGFQVDGMDPVAVKTAVEHIFSDENKLVPCFLEIDTYRYYHHAGKIPGSSFGYREKEEEERWRSRDPIDLCESRMKKMGLITDGEISLLKRNAEKAVAEAVEECTLKSSADTLSIREELWPSHESTIIGLRDDRTDRIGPFTEAEDTCCIREIKYPDAIAEVTGRWLEKEPFAFVLGEEVANMGGGAYGATKGLPKIFPDRVRNTPITEAGFCGLACGAAMNGMRPIVELMFSSFGLVAADQLFNQIGQLAHIYGGNTSIPLVVRTRIAIGLGYGAQHSMDPVAMFALFPGWRIFFPTTPFDYIGLFNTAMKLKSPTLIVEHHEFYGIKGKIPEGHPDHFVEPGKAKILRPGKDATVVTYGWMSSVGMEAAAKLEAEGIDPEIIDLRTLDDASLDIETIGRSLKKTGMLVVLEQAPSSNSIGGKIISRCERKFFDYFDGPPVTLNAPDIPLPVSKRIETLCVPTVNDAVETIRKAARRET